MQPKSDTRNPAHVAFESLHYEYSVRIQSALRLTESVEKDYNTIKSLVNKAAFEYSDSADSFLAASGGLYDQHRLCRSHCEPGCIRPSIGVESCISNKHTRSYSCRIWSSKIGSGFQVTHRNAHPIAGVNLCTNLNFISARSVIRVLTNFIMSPAIKNPEPNLDISFQGNNSLPC